MNIPDLFVVLMVVFCPIAGLLIERFPRREQPRVAGYVLLVAIPLVFGVVLSNLGIHPLSIAVASASCVLMTIGYFVARNRISAADDS